MPSNSNISTNNKNHVPVLNSNKLQLQCPYMLKAMKHIEIDNKEKQNNKDNKDTKNDINHNNKDDHEDDNKDNNDSKIEMNSILNHLEDYNHFECVKLCKQKCTTYDDCDMFTTKLSDYSKYLIHQYLKQHKPRIRNLDSKTSINGNTDVNTTGNSDDIDENKSDNISLTAASKKNLFTIFQYN